MTYKGYAIDIRRSDNGWISDINPTRDGIVGLIKGRRLTVGVKPTTLGPFANRFQAYVAARITIDEAFSVAGGTSSSVPKFP